MTAEEILKKIDENLDELVRGSMGSMWKEDFFNLFRIAYKEDYFESSSTPRLTRDAMRDTFKQRWAEPNEKKEECFEKVATMWDEWYFALKQVGYEIK